MQKITPFLWFDNQAEEAMDFYSGIFPNAKISNVVRYGKEGAQVAGRPEGSVMTATMDLAGQEFYVLNGGPQFKFTEAISFFVKCDNQEEVDHYWSKLTDGGEEQPCGWLKDKFGLSWQIIPNALGELLSNQDPVKAERVMHAMFQMKKIDIKTLEQARDQQ